jgi:transposase
LQKKKEITDRLTGWREAIEAGELIVVYVDECHLIWDDARGYVWGKVNERITIDMTNFRQRQTYYGAIEQCHGTIVIIPAPAGNGESTVAFINVLREKYPDKRFVLIWDGASYHSGEEMRTYLQQVNNGLGPDEWLVTCLLFAPNAPEQNPMEDVWLKGKQFGILPMIPGQMGLGQAARRTRSRMWSAKVGVVAGARSRPRK